MTASPTISYITTGWYKHLARFFERLRKGLLPYFRPEKRHKQGSKYLSCGFYFRRKGGINIKQVDNNTAAQFATTKSPQKLAFGRIPWHKEKDII